MCTIGMTHMQHQAVDICYSSNGDISDCNSTKLLSLAYQLYVLPVLSVLQRYCTQSVTNVWHAEGTFGSLPTQAGQGMYTHGNAAAVKKMAIVCCKPHCLAFCKLDYQTSTDDLAPRLFDGKYITPFNSIT